MELGKVSEKAIQIIKIIQPFCDKVIIVGSLRRKKSLVNDIDIVLVPKNLSGLRGLIYQISDKILLNGDKIIRFEYKGIKVDMYVANNQNYEVITLFKTGSKEHNIKLCATAIKLGYKLGNHGLINREGKVIANREKEMDELQEKVKSFAEYIEYRKMKEVKK